VYEAGLTYRTVLAAKHLTLREKTKKLIVNINKMAAESLGARMSVMLQQN
jgi:hypothetical protein